LPQKEYIGIEKQKNNKINNNNIKSALVLSGTGKGQKMYKEGGTEIPSWTQNIPQEKTVEITN